MSGVEDVVRTGSNSNGISGVPLLTSHHTVNTHSGSASHESQPDLYKDNKGFSMQPARERGKFTG